MPSSKNFITLKTPMWASRKLLCTYIYHILVTAFINTDLKRHSHGIRSLTTVEYYSKYNLGVKRLPTLANARHLLKNRSSDAYHRLRLQGCKTFRHYISVISRTQKCAVKKHRIDTFKDVLQPQKFKTTIILGHQALPQHGKCIRL